MTTVEDRVGRARSAQGTGYSQANTWGGPGYTRYYTPSGKVVWGIPAIHEWVETDPDNPKKVIATGERDANLDKGWLTSPPDPNHLMLDCAGCGRWHWTQEEVDEHVKAKKAQALAWEEKAKQMRRDGVGVDTTALEERVGRLENGVEQILRILKGEPEPEEDDDGGIFQHQTAPHESAAPAEEDRDPAGVAS